jgi:serine/threonine-protein kinase
VPIVCQLLAGLGAAHRASIVHRDLKPDNIYILKEKAGRRDFVKIIDFGISKFWTPTSELRMTRTGVVMGTAYYMSPEHAGGKEVDGRSDIYSAGVVLYEAVTGRVPFLATSYNELIIQIVTAAPKPAQEYVPDLPPPFCAIMDKALARDPAARFQTADEFAQALVDWVSAKSRGQTVNLGDVRNLFVGGIPVVTGPQPVSPLTPMPTGAPWANTGRESRAKSSAALVALGGAGVLIVVAVLAGAGWLFMHRGTTPAAAPPDSVAVVAAPPIVPRPVADVVDAAAEAAPAAEVVNAGAGGSMDGTGGRAGESGARAGGTGGRAATSGGPRPVAGPKCDPRIGYCPPAKRGAH